MGLGKGSDIVRMIYEKEIRQFNKIEKCEGYHVVNTRYKAALQALYDSGMWPLHSVSQGYIQSVRVSLTQKYQTQPTPQTEGRP